jgi:hypothetical protein
MAAGICMLVSCSLWRGTPPPRPRAVAVRTPRATATPGAPLVHRVDWPGQTLVDLARWYTGTPRNWRKLAAPTNADLTECCEPLRVGIEVKIPRELVVQEAPLPRPTPTARRTRAVRTPAAPAPGAPTAVESEEVLPREAPWSPDEDLPPVVGPR